MTEIIPLILIMTELSMLAFLFVRNLRYKEYEEGGDRLAPAMLLVNACLVLADCVSGGDRAVRFSLDLLLLISPLSVLASRLWDPRLVRRICLVSAVLQLLLASYYILCALDFAELPSLSCLVLLVLSASLMNAALVFRGIWARISNIRDVMKSGTVLTSLALEVEMAYVAAMQTLPLLLLSVLLLSQAVSGVMIFLALFMELLLVAALCLRIGLDTGFVILYEHERRIIESMKISQVEIAAGGKRDTYRDLYERLVDYFEKDKPFLDNRLTINDVVKVVFSNKVYISRAISQYTGRNFCQFVNYYRISYSVDCFRENPELKITELSEMSGFNSVVSYNTAFRLFMNENPSDWCRKERHKIRNKKK